MGENLFFNSDAAAVVAAEGAVGADDAMAGNFGIKVFAHDHADSAGGAGVAGEGGDLFISHGLAGWDFLDDFVDGRGEIWHCFLFTYRV